MHDVENNENSMQPPPEPSSLTTKVSALRKELSGPQAIAAWSLLFAYVESGALFRSGARLMPDNFDVNTFDSSILESVDTYLGPSIMLLVGAIALLFGISEVVDRGNDLRKHYQSLDSSRADGVIARRFHQYLTLSWVAFAVCLAASFIPTLFFLGLSFFIGSICLFILSECEWTRLSHAESTGAIKGLSLQDLTSSAQCLTALAVICLLVGPIVREFSASSSLAWLAQSLSIPAFIFGILMERQEKKRAGDSK